MFFQLVSYLVVGIGSLTSVPGQASQSLDSVAQSVLRIDARDCLGNDTFLAANRSATGFIWRDKDTAITALHVVAGCSNISIYYQGKKLSRPARVLKVLRRADLVLLSIADAPDAPPLLEDSGDPAGGVQLETLGFQLQIPEMSSTHLSLRYGGKKLKDIVPSSVADTLKNIGSPDLDLEITNIEGHLVPGLSGAPIFNQKGKVVSIGDGGLENGAVGISWGIPAQLLHDLASSKEAVTSISNTLHNAPLFSAESQASSKGEVSCSGLPLIRLRTASFSQIAGSSDDVLGLSQLINYFNVNPASFSFDIYQHLASGATVVVPSGTTLTPNATGCEARMSDGSILMEVELASLTSDAEIQSRSQQNESDQVGGAIQGWYPDPAFTYVNVLPRFDGLLVRRKSFVHMDSTKIAPGTIPQDRYLFETIAARGHFLITVAAINNFATVQNNQKAMACRLDSTGDGCLAVNRRSDDWVRAVISIHLASFPIG